MFECNYLAFVRIALHDDDDSAARLGLKLRLFSTVDCVAGGFNREERTINELDRVKERADGIDYLF